MPIQPSRSRKPSEQDQQQIDAVAQARLAQAANTTPKLRVTPRGQPLPQTTPTPTATQARLELAIERERQKLEAARLRANATKYRARTLAQASTANQAQKAQAAAAHDKAKRLEIAAKKRLEALKAQQRLDLQQQRYQAQAAVVQQRNVAQGRAAVGNKGALADYLRANGRMSVARRTAVVEPALERLGYTPDQAHTITLDAPLDASMTDQQALYAALQYARTLATPNALSAAIAGDQTQVGQQLAGQQGAIPMPDAATVALRQADEANAPIPQQLGNKSGLGSLSTRLSRLGRALSFKIDDMANVPTPAGIGGLFIVNLLFLFFAVPANSQGYTRAALGWLTLLNRTSLPEQVPTEAIPASPLVAAAVGAASAIGNVAQSIGSLGQNAAQVVGALANPGQAIEQQIQQNPGGGAAGTGILGGLIPGAAGGGPPIMGAGGGPPLPPMPPAFPHGVPLP